MKKQLLLLLLLVPVLQSRAQTKNIHYLCEPQSTYAVPAHFGPGSMGGFYTYSEAIAQLDSMRLWYPGLISEKTQIGTSIEGRAIYQVRISDHPDSTEAESQVLFTALHHSQEPASLQQLIMFMYYLLEHYSSDPEIQYWVDNLDINFVPVINPDGYVYNEQQYPSGGGTWRKNRRPGTLGDGVDLNRNYDYAFGYNEIGSSSLEFHPWYRGDSAFSEPESRAMRDFIEAHDFKLALNWHSYGNFLIYPWNYETLLTDDSTLFEQFSRYLTLENHYRYGTCDQTYGYNSNGDADDWAYGNNANKNKIISFTAEIGSSADGFWPAAANITELCRQSLDMNLRFTRLAGQFALANDLGPAYLRQTQGSIPMETYCLGLDVPASFTISLTGLSPEIIATGTSYSVSGMNTLDRHLDSVSYTLDASTDAGTHLKFLLQISNGSYTWADTLYKIYTPVDTLFADACNDFNQWTNSGWQASGAQYVSSPSAFTESPDGDYGLLQSASMEMLNATDLTGYTSARLQFKAKWMLEIAYDWMEIYVSTDDGSSWTPLCGRYASYGSDDQSFTEPVYDGFFNQWVTEEIPLDTYTGGPLKIKFTFNSDQTHSFDGVWLDDIFILAQHPQPSGDREHQEEESLLIYPNPANDQVFIDCGIPAKEIISITVCDLPGKSLRNVNQIRTAGSERLLDVSELCDGIYLIRLQTTTGTVIRKLSVLH